MTFDLFTVAAQIVNFALLLVLLRIFLYRPVLRAMREREQHIAHDRAAAEEAREEARAEADALRREREAFERQGRERERELEERLGERRERRLEEIEEEAESARRALARALERDRDDALAALRLRSGELLTRELRRALAQLADASLERRSVAAFRRRAAEIDGEVRAELARAARAGEPVRIRTAFEPDDEVRGELAAIARDLLGSDAAPTFETDEALGFGATLEAGGVQVGWTAEGFVRAFEASLEATLDELRGASGDAAGAEADTARTPAEGAHDR